MEIPTEAPRTPAVSHQPQQTADQEPSGKKQEYEEWKDEVPGLVPPKQPVKKAPPKKRSTKKSRRKSDIQFYFERGSFELTGLEAGVVGGTKTPIRDVEDERFLIGIGGEPLLFELQVGSFLEQDVIGLGLGAGNTAPIDDGEFTYSWGLKGSWFSANEEDDSYTFDMREISWNLGIGTALDPNIGAFVGYRSSRFDGDFESTFGVTQLEVSGQVAGPYFGLKFGDGNAQGRIELRSGDWDGILFGVHFQ